MLLTKEMNNAKIPNYKSSKGVMKYFLFFLVFFIFEAGLVYSDTEPDSRFSYLAPMTAIGDIATNREGVYLRLADVLHNLITDNTGGSSDGIYTQLTELVRHLHKDFPENMRVTREKNIEINDNYGDGRVDVYLTIVSEEGVHRYLFQFYSTKELIPASLSPFMGSLLPSASYPCYSGTLQRIAKFRDKLKGYGVLLSKLNPNSMGKDDVLIGDTATEVPQLPARRSQLERKIKQDFSESPQSSKQETGKESRQKAMEFIETVNLANRLDLMITDEELRQLGLTKKQFVARYLKMQEQVRFMFIEPKDGKGDLFLGLEWNAADQYTFFHANYGDDDLTPTIYVNNDLRTYLFRSQTSGIGQSEALNYITALRLVLGFKLMLSNTPLTPDLKKMIDRISIRIQREYFKNIGQLAHNATGDTPDPLKNFLTERARRYAEYRAILNEEGPEGRIKYWQFLSRYLFNLIAEHREYFKDKQIILPAMSDFLESIAIDDPLAEEAVRAFKEKEAFIIFGNLVKTSRGEGVLIVGDNHIGKSNVTARLVLPSMDGVRNDDPWQFGASDFVLTLCLPPDTEHGIDAQVLAMASPAHDPKATELSYRDSDAREVHPTPQVPPLAEMIPVRNIVLLFQGTVNTTKKPIKCRQDIEELFHKKGVIATKNFLFRLLYSRALKVHAVSMERPSTSNFTDAANKIRHIVNTNASQAATSDVMMRIKSYNNVYYVGTDHDPVKGAAIEVIISGPDGYDRTYRIYASGEVVLQNMLWSEGKDLNAFLRELGNDLPDQQNFILPGKAGMQYTFDKALVETDSNGQSVVRTETGTRYPVHRYIAGREAPVQLLIPGITPEVKMYLLKEIMEKDEETWSGWLEHWEKWIDSETIAFFLQENPEYWINFLKNDPIQWQVWLRTWKKIISTRTVRKIMRENPVKWKKLLVDDESFQEWINTWGSKALEDAIKVLTDQIRVGRQLAYDDATFSDLDLSLSDALSLAYAA